MDLSVVFPVYNEEENIPILLGEIANALGGTPWSYELIAVDDGSRDRSLEGLRAEEDRHPTLRIITLEKNSGQTAPPHAGLQNAPADIPPMLRKLEETGADMVIGVRVNRQDTWARKVQSRIGNGVRNWITRDQITDTGCSLKLARRAAIEPVRLYTGMHRFLPTLVRMHGFKVVEMPVNHRPRRFGTSKYGAMNRAFRGLADCFAVRWMGKRVLTYKIKDQE